MNPMGPPGDLGNWGMPPHGMVPPYGGGAPMWWGNYGFGGHGMPPPFPPGMNMYGGYGGQTGPGGFGGHPPGNMGQAGQHEAGGQGGRNQRKQKNNSQLSLSEHLGEGSNRSPKGKGKGDSAPAAEHVSTVAPEDLSTVMLRNVPNGYTRGMLLELLNTTGFQSRYDFVYLPMDFRNGVNLGYAFVNLINNKDAVDLTEKFQGFREWISDSTKVCEVSWAHPHQGLQEHVERYRNSPVMHPSMPEDYKPMVFRNGQQIAFPVPTKAIKAPKLRLTVRDGRTQGQEDGAGPPGRGTQSGAAPNFVAVCA